MYDGQVTKMITQHDAYVKGTRFSEYAATCSKP